MSEIQTEKKSRNIDYASQISDTPDAFREKAEQYKREDGSYEAGESAYTLFGERCLFLADVKEFPNLSLSKLSRKHDKAPATCKHWVELYIEGGIEGLTAPITRSGAGRSSGGAPPKLQAEHIELIKDFCNESHVTTIEQIRDMLVEKLELTSLGLSSIKALLDRNDLHLGNALYVAEGAAPKRTRKPKSAEMPEGTSDEVDEDEEDDDVDSVEDGSDDVEDDSDDEEVEESEAEESSPVVEEKPARGRRK